MTFMWITENPKAKYAILAFCTVVLLCVLYKYFTRNSEKFNSADSDSENDEDDDNVEEFEGDEDEDDEDEEEDEDKDKAE